MFEACRVGPEFTVTELWGSMGFYGPAVGLAERRLRSFESGFAGFRIQGDTPSEMLRMRGSGCQLSLCECAGAEGLSSVEHRWA